MKGMKTMPPTRPTRKAMVIAKALPVDRLHHELLIRRTTNHNVHVITPHGKIHLGRKGR